MSQCPVCGVEITEDFGIVECEGCQAQLIIHLDGRVEHAGSKDSDNIADQIEMNDSVPAVDEPVGFEFPPEEEAELIEPMREFEMEPDPESLPPALPEFTNMNEEEDVITSRTERTPARFREPAPDLSQVNDDMVEPLGDPLSVLDLTDESAPSDSYDSGRKKPHAIDSPDLADVAKFANSADSGGRDGSLRYTLFIEGIDTADVREAFKEAITDKKLLWDTENILRNIKRGVVKIENVSSAKAHIVVTRLKLLPVSVSWEQHAIHEG